LLCWGLGLQRPKTLEGFAFDRAQLWGGEGRKIYRDTCPCLLHNENSHRCTCRQHGDTRSQCVCQCGRRRPQSLRQHMGDLCRARQSLASCWPAARSAISATEEQEGWQPLTRRGRGRAGVCPMKMFASALVLGSVLLTFSPIAAPQLGGTTAHAQRCGSSYVRCEKRNPGQFWSILSPRQKMKVITGKRRTRY